MRVGLIGAGRIGSLHADLLANLPAIDHLVVADIDADRAAALAAELGADHVSRPEDVFDRVDGVVIASATETHVPYVVAAAEHGVPAFCEKPLATDLAATDRARAVVHDTGSICQIGFMRRFDDGYVAARETVSSGALGELLLVVSQTHDIEPAPEAYVAESGGVFADMLIHEFDVLRFVTGSEVVEVTATGSNRSMPMFSEYEDLATAVVTATLDDDSIAVISGVRRDPLGYDVRMELFGTEDSVAVGLTPQTPLHSLEPGLDFAATSTPIGWIERFGAAYRAELETFIDVAAGRTENPCTVDDARAALVIAEACKLAAARRRPVRIEEIQ